MKKLLSLVLALMLVLSCAAFAEEVIVAENGEVQNPEAIVAGENELIFWSLFSGGEGSVMESFVADYNATNPEYTVRNVQLNWGEYYTKLTTAVAVGQGPDIGISHQAKLPELYDLGVVTDLSEAIASAELNLDAINPTALAASTIDGGIYSIPLDTHPNVLFYNKDLLADFLNEDGTLTLPTGMAEFTAWLNEVQAAMPEGVAAFSFPTTGDDPFRMFWGNYYQLTSTPVITSDLEITMDKDATVQVLNDMKVWYDDGVIPFQLSDYIQYFTTGNAAITVGGVWNTFTVEHVEGLNFGMTLLPQLYENNYAIWGDGHTLIVPTKDTHTPEIVEACVKFFKFASENSITWANAGHVPANIEVAYSPEFDALQYRADYRDAANSVVYFEPNPFSYPIRDAMIAQIGAFFSGEQDAEATYDAIVEEIESTVA